MLRRAPACLSSNMPRKWPSIKTATTKNKKYWRSLPYDNSNWGWLTFRRNKINCDKTIGELICMLFKRVWALLRESREGVMRFLRWEKKGGGSAVEAHISGKPVPAQHIDNVGGYKMFRRLKIQDSFVLIKYQLQTIKRMKEKILGDCSLFRKCKKYSKSIRLHNTNIQVCNQNKYIGAAYTCIYFNVIHTRTSQM